MIFYLPQCSKVSLGERRLYTSPDCNGNLAGAKRRPHCNGKRDYRWCKPCCFASTNKLKFFVAAILCLLFVDAIGQTTENSINNLEQEVVDLLPYNEGVLQKVTEADLPVSLIVSEKNYESLINYDEYLKQSLSENGALDVFMKKCMIYIESSKIIPPPKKSTLSEIPESKSSPID